MCSRPTLQALQLENSQIKMCPPIIIIPTACGHSMAQSLVHCFIVKD